MDMAYSNNPYLPRVRMQAVLLVRQGLGVRQAARYIGVSPGTVSKWMARAPAEGNRGIPTESSRPQTSPLKIPLALERQIIEERLRTKRCGQVVHHTLRKQGVAVSLSTVQRVLARNHLTKQKSPWKSIQVQFCCLR